MCSTNLWDKNIKLSNDSKLISNSWKIFIFIYSNYEEYKESFKMYIYSIFDNKLNYLSFIILFINVSNYSY